MRQLSNLKIKQLHYESDTWKRLLEFVIDENIHLKNRLSEVLSDGFGKNSMEEIENFQNRFMKEDELIGLLRHEVAELDKLLKREIFEDGKIIQVVDRKLKKIRNNLSNTEKQFSKLKLEFNNYLGENV